MYKCDERLFVLPKYDIAQLIKRRAHSDFYCLILLIEYYLQSSSPRQKNFSSKDLKKIFKMTNWRDKRFNNRLEKLCSFGLIHKEK